jgi:hypothetical protein
MLSFPKRYKAKIASASGRGRDLYSVEREKRTVVWMRDNGRGEAARI